MVASFKSFLGMLLLSVVLVQIVSAAPPPGKKPTPADLFAALGNRVKEEPLRTCPNEFLVFYSKCQGELQACANCLGVAERNCRDAAKKKGTDENICNDCTRSRNGKCKGIAEMCFGDQECRAGFECVNYKCIDPKERFT